MFILLPKMKDNSKDIENIYDKWLGDYKKAPEDLDYIVLEKYAEVLELLARTTNSVVTVFDLYQKKHVFHSSNLGAPLGYDLENIGEKKTFLYSKMHQDDFEELNRNALLVVKLFDDLCIDEKVNYKLVNEFRMMNSSDKYVKIILQLQVLELDSNGNLWLALCIFDMAPDQKNMNEGVNSELLNYRTGKIIPFEKEQEKTVESLSKRELEVLKLVKDGFLSKEISNKLSISLHTVNTHRQKILGKLSVSNSMEAVVMASKLGLI